MADIINFDYIVYLQHTAKTVLMTFCMYLNFRLKRRRFLDQLTGSVERQLWQLGQMVRIVTRLDAQKSKHVLTRFDYDYTLTMLQ